MSNDLACSPKDLMNVIKVDPVLTGRVLTLINSSYFGLPQRITSLNRALILLGFNTIKNIAISTAFLDANFFPKKNKHANEIWQHLLGVGVASKKIATAAGQPRQMLEDFFVSGLLHDIGDLILLKYSPDILISHLKTELDVREIFKKEIDITGPECGIMLAQHWKLPLSFSSIIEHREHTGEKADIVNAVHTGDKIIRQLDIGFSTDLFDLQITDDEIKMLKLERKDIDDIKNSLPEELAKAQYFISDNA